MTCSSTQPSATPRTFRRQLPQPEASDRSQAEHSTPTPPHSRGTTSSGSYADFSTQTRDAPGVVRFRGKKVVPADDWEWGDGKTLPDSFHLLVFLNEPNSPNWPKDWMRDYLDLLWKLEDKEYGAAICGNCAINLAQEAQQDINERKQEGEEAERENLQDATADERAQAAREEAMRTVHHAFYDDGDGANGRSCHIVNFFRCPYSEEREELVESGRFFREIWHHHLEWYERHWHNNYVSTPAENEKRWYHWNEPKPINLTNADDVVKSLEDGRYDKVVDEHERYMKETHQKIWSL